MIISARSKITKIILDSESPYFMSKMSNEHIYPSNQAEVKLTPTAHIQGTTPNGILLWVTLFPAGACQYFSLQNKAQLGGSRVDGPCGPMSGYRSSDGSLYNYMYETC